MHHPAHTWQVQGRTSRRVCFCSLSTSHFAFIPWFHIFILWSTFSPGRTSSHIAEVSGKLMVIFPPVQAMEMSVEDWQSLTQCGWLLKEGGCISVGALDVMHECKRQWEHWPPCHPRVSRPLPHLHEAGKERTPSLQAGLYVLSFPPLQSTVRTVGEQVILLERTERVCTSKARLPWQRGMSDAVLRSRRNGRLKLVFIPGGFAPTCKTGYNQP